MPESPSPGQTSLEAKSPYELRVDLGAGVPESELQAALADGQLGFLHSFTTGSTVDGPGVRLVAWTTGCMWRCLYCHNPDTWTLRNGIPVSVTKAAEEIGRYRQGLRIMSGGFTISGGEPLMQHRFVVRLLTAARTMGIHTALDTNGYLGERLTDDELEKIDLVLLDLKAWDPGRHRRLTGFDVGPTLEFARRLGARGKPMWIRFVFVPGWSDDPGTIAGIAGFAAGLGNVERVDILPFHQLGRFKWERLGIRYTLQELQPPPEESIQRARAAFLERGLKAC